jgi:hypothetical protein
MRYTRPDTVFYFHYINLRFEFQILLEDIHKLVSFPYVNFYYVKYDKTIL